MIGKIVAALPAVANCRTIDCNHSNIIIHYEYFLLSCDRVCARPIPSALLLISNENNNKILFFKAESGYEWSLIFMNEE